MENVFIFYPAQRTILTVVGFISPISELNSKSPKFPKKCSNAVRATIPIILIVGGLLSALHETLIIPEAIKETFNREQTILEVLAFLPYVCEALRGPVVLIIFINKRSRLAELTYLANNLIVRCFGNQVRHQVFSAKFSVVFAVYSFAAVITWTCGEWFVMVNEKQIYELNLTMDAVLYRSVFNLSVIQYVCAMIVFEALPFWLSQQVFAILITFTLLLTSLINKVNEEIQEMSDNVPAGNRIEGWGAETEKKAARLQGLHLDLLSFCHELQLTFGMILFVIYGLDVLTFVGFVCNLETAQMDYLSQYLMNFGSLILFGFYTTVSFFPFVAAYEKGSLIAFSLYEFMVISQPYQETGKKEKKLCVILKSFHSASLEHAFLFSGAHIMHFTRSFLVQTLATTLSFAVLAYEIFEKVKPVNSAATPGTNLTTHNNCSVVHSVLYQVL